MRYNNATTTLIVANAYLIGTTPGNTTMLFGSCIFDQATDVDPASAGSVLYDANGDLYYAKALVEGSWVNLPKITSCTLTIIHHPLPSA